MERILLVDDEPTVCEVLALVLQPQGYETVAVGSCAEARAEVLRGNYAAVVLDKNLPDGNGVELRAELRAAVPDTALLMMTGYSSFDTAVQAMRLGASDYLVKPFSALDEVVLRVRKAIEDRRCERQRLMVESDLRAGIESAKNELATIFEAAAEPILVFDLDGRIRRKNAAATRVYAHVEAGLDLAALGDPGGAEAIRRAAAGEIVRRERVVRSSAQGPIAMNATLAPIRDHSGRVSAVVETAISIEETLRAQKVIHQADKMATLGALAATLAHELANPIGCALSNMTMLGEIDGDGRVTGTDAADANEIVKEVRASLEHCREIIRRTREFAAPNQNRRAPVVVSAVVDDSLKFVGPQLTHKAKVTVDIPESLTIFGERTGMVQVLMNLLVNASHALKGRSEGHVTVTAREDGQEVVLCVGDNGCGIPAHELGRIWDRFFTTKPADQGTGLGLAVCRDVVRGYGGSISVESEPGKGTTFEIRLPAWKPSQPAKVLIVDDDPLVLAATARALRGHFDVCTALNAEEAIELLNNDNLTINVVLSDLIMPGASGAELLKLVMHKWPNMKRMIMTASLDPRSKLLIYEQAQPIEILTKPLETMMLRNRLMSALA